MKAFFDSSFAKLSVVSTSTWFPCLTVVIVVVVVRYPLWWLNKQTKQNKTHSVFWRRARTVNDIYSVNAFTLFLWVKISKSFVGPFQFQMLVKARMVWNILRTPFYSLKANGVEVSFHCHSIQLNSSQWYSHTRNEVMRARARMAVGCSVSFSFSPLSHSFCQIDRRRTKVSDCVCVSVLWEEPWRYVIGVTDCIRLFMLFFLSNGSKCQIKMKTNVH